MTCNSIVLAKQLTKLEPQNKIRQQKRVVVAILVLFGYCLLFNIVLYLIDIIQYYVGLKFESDVEVKRCLTTNKMSLCFLSFLEQPRSCNKPQCLLSFILDATFFFLCSHVALKICAASIKQLLVVSQHCTKVNLSTLSLVVCEISYC